MVPEGWIETRLGTSAQVNPRTKRPSVEQVSFLAMADVSETAQVIQYDTRQLQEVQSGFTIFSRDDVIVAKITPCFENGKGAYLTEMPSDVGYGSTEFHVIRAKAGETDAGYLNLLVNSVPFRERGARNMQGSAGQRRVPVDFIKAYPLHLPPLPEQRKIADILSTWDQAIDKTEALLSNARTQKRALMQQLLTGKRRFPAYEGQPWKEVRLGDVADVIVSNVDKKSQPGELPVRLCNYTDVFKRDTINPTQDFMSATAKPAQIDKFGLRVGDVIITKDSETAAEIAMPTYVAATADDLVCGYHLAIIRPHANVAGRFLKFFFDLPHTRYYFGTRANGAIRFGLTIDGIEGALMNLPPKDEQDQIAAVIAVAEDAIADLVAEISKLHTEKKALMQQLLTGKRRVKVEDHHAV